MAAARPCRRASSSIGQDAGDRPQRAVEGQLAHEQHVGRGAGSESAPSAASRPTAVARSKDEPYLRRLAGARLTVMRRSHLNSMPQLRSAARMRASLSFTAESGEPDHREAGEAGGGVGLDADEVGLDAEDGGGERRGEHGSLLDGRRERAVDGRSATPRAGPRRGPAGGASVLGACRCRS